MDKSDPGPELYKLATCKTGTGQDRTGRWRPPAWAVELALAQVRVKLTEANEAATGGDQEQRPRATTDVASSTA